VNQNTDNTVATVKTETAIAEVDKLLKEKQDLAKALRAQQKLEEWEEKTIARNPQYVKGSVRKPTAKDEAELGHVHGMVCSIKCQVCGKLRTINKQDAFQCRFCKEHKNEARKASAKAKRQAAKLDNKSAEEIQAEIDDLRAELTAKETKAEPKKAKAKRAKAS
jgi:hypothetical protein